MVRRKYVLDTNCFIDAAGNRTALEAYAAFCAAAAPGLYLSAVVGAELRVGARDPAERRRLEDLVIAPYTRRDRVLTPSTRSWETLGTTLSRLRDREGLEPARTPRSFLFDILVAHACREAGATLISRNTRDLERIASCFTFEFAAPYPRPR